MIRYILLGWLLVAGIFVVAMTLFVYKFEDGGVRRVSKRMGFLVMFIGLLAALTWTYGLAQAARGYL